MKKFIVVIFLTLSLFLLTSCGKIKFEDLPKERQTEIQNKIKEDVIAPYIKEILSLAFQNLNATKEESDKIMNTKNEEFKQNLIKYLASNYSDIEFDIEKISKVDNSNTESAKQEPIKKYKNIKLGEYYTFIDNDDKDKSIKIHINKDKILWKGNKIEDGYLEYNANNNFLVIRLESENIGKKPTFKSFSDIKLITKDGIEYKYSDSIQVSNTKEGYLGCIQCETNPGDKAEEDILFDIKKIDLAGAKLRFEDDLVDFEF